MLNWEKFWNTKPGTFDKSDYFRQVGKTLHGQPLSQSQFDFMISEILQRLNLKPDDNLLDLCCGNGIITNELAKYCKEVVGIDFSRPLIEIANRDHSRTNVGYRCASLLKLDTTTLAPMRFNKVLMYDALENFRKSDLPLILKKIVSMTAEPRLILIGGVPRQAKKFNFYNTFEKRLRYLLRRIVNKELIGTWWTEDDFRHASESLSLKCSFHDQSEGLYNRNIRFDIIIF